jgi:tetratricopeptide (TPR) repeat protein
MLPVLLLMLQTAPAVSSVAIPADPQERLNQCVALATSSAKLGEAAATRWRSEGGGYRAKQCLGVAYANQDRWDAAASAFEEAARDSEASKAARSADIWAQAGNAWLASGDAAKARRALDAALVTGALSGDALGEVHLDRARARMKGGDAEGARSDIDRALGEVPADPLAWLLSATLARIESDDARAAKDITQALRLSPDDPSIHLEEGLIAGTVGDDTAARAAFARVIELAPGTPLADQARGWLDKLGAAQQ